MGRGKEPEQQCSNPVEAKKYRDEASGHFKNGNYGRALTSLDKTILIFTGVKISVSECENTFSHHDNHGPGVDIDDSLHTYILRNNTSPLICSSCTMSLLKTLESEDNAKAQVRSILGPTKDAEFLQSFVRVGAGYDEDELPVPKATISKRAPPSAEKTESFIEDEKFSAAGRKESIKPQKRKFRRKPKRERRRREEELYTDKDRAAAVVMGSKDIKHSLSLKDKAERSNALQIPEEADAGTLLALARAEMMRERYRTALTFVDKAIELAPEEKAAFVSRSKCYLLLGEPRKALEDAEIALKLDPKYAKALLQKAEALYYCGEFEMSLVHYHRGLRARPDLNEFRLGVQKAQEAIENTIGAVKPVKKTTKRSTSKTSRPVLGQLMSDKIYLENLLKNPDLAIADKKNNTVMKQAEEAIRFLENREEFWRQQQTAKRH